MNFFPKSTTLPERILQLEGSILQSESSLHDQREQLLHLKIRERKEHLRTHRVFSSLRSVHDLRKFMEWHVFAVWDFMTLLKRLQQEFTCTNVIWTPPAFPELAHLINQIVCGEETDQTPTPHVHSSHFELYLAAMKEVSADTRPIESFIRLISSGVPPETALEDCSVPHGVRAFVGHTLAIARNAQPSEVLGSFFHGREDIVPQMFEEIITRSSISASTAPYFYFYLKRHIELDSGEHGPAAQRMIDLICGKDAALRLSLLSTALTSVQARIGFWDDFLTHHNL
jgi:hypothetical protein